MHNSHICKELEAFDIKFHLCLIFTLVVGNFHASASALQILKCKCGCRCKESGLALKTLGSKPCLHELHVASSLTRDSSHLCIWSFYFLIAWTSILLWQPPRLQFHVISPRFLQSHTLLFVAMVAFEVWLVVGMRLKTLTIPVLPFVPCNCWAITDAITMRINLNGAKRRAWSKTLFWLHAWGCVYLKGRSRLYLSFQKSLKPPPPFPSHDVASTSVSFFFIV